MESGSAARSRASAPASPLRWGIAGGTVVLVVLALAHLGLTVEGLVAAFSLCVVAVLTVVDLEERRIPNRIVLPATAVVLSTQVALDPGRAPELLASALGVSLFLALPLLVSRQGVGMGDLKLGFFLGAALGKAALAAVAVAVIAAFPVALALLVRHGAAGRGQAFAFGPFLALGAAVAILLT